LEQQQQQEELQHQAAENAEQRAEKARQKAENEAKARDYLKKHHIAKYIQAERPLWFSEHLRSPEQVRP
jgi:hypothetical protein